MLRPLGTGRAVLCLVGSILVGATYRAGSTQQAVLLGVQAGPVHFYSKVAGACRMACRQPVARAHTQTPRTATGRVAAAAAAAAAAASVRQTAPRETVRLSASCTTARTPRKPELPYVWSHPTKQASYKRSRPRRTSNASPARRQPERQATPPLQCSLPTVTGCLCRASRATRTCGGPMRPWPNPRQRAPWNRLDSMRARPGQAPPRAYVILCRSAIIIFSSLSLAGLSVPCSRCCCDCGGGGAARPQEREKPAYL